MKPDFASGVNHLNGETQGHLSCHTCITTATNAQSRPPVPLKSLTYPNLVTLIFFRAYSVIFTVLF